jgi:hypothetical protein
MDYAKLLNDIEDLETEEGFDNSKDVIVETRDGDVYEVVEIIYDKEYDSVVIKTGKKA